MNEKNYSISVIRLVSMLMIICCHILQGLNNRWAFWINVGVQIFFFMSGFLYGKKIINNDKEFYKKRIIKIFVPYIVILTIILFLDCLLLKNTYSIKEIIGCYIGFGGFGNNISILSHTWFVSYILLCYMLVPLLQGIFNQDHFRSNFICFILIISMAQLISIYGIISIEMSWINNFIFGYFYGKICDERKQEKFFNIFVIALFIVIMPIAIIYQEHIQVVLPNILNKSSNIIINYGHVLLGTLIFIVLYKVLNIIKPNKNIVLQFFDKYSYYIYLVHQIYILYSFSILFLTKYLAVNIILILIFSVISAIILKFITDFLLTLCNKIYRKLEFTKN